MSTRTIKKQLEGEMKELNDKYVRYLHTLNKSTVTIDSYTSTLKKIILDENINSIDDFANMDVHWWLDFVNKQKGKTSISTINKKIKQMSSFYKFLNIEGVCLTNPCYKFPRINENFDSEYKEKVISDEEERAIKRVCENLPLERRSLYLNQRTKTLINLAFDCGMRIDEFTKVRISDIILDENKILIRSKGHNDRIHRFNYFSNRTKKMIEKLISYFPNREFLFTPSDNVNKRIDTQSIRKEWLYVQNLANINHQYTFHNIRHTCGSKLILKYSIQEVALFLGHSNISTIQKYYIKPTDSLKGMSNRFDD